MDYIDYIKRRFEKLHLERFYDRFDCKYEIKKALSPRALATLIFDWRSQSFSSEIGKIKKGCPVYPM